MQIIEILPIGGKRFMHPDNLSSNAYQPFNKSNYDKGIVPQWNPYIFGGMPWAFLPHPIMMTAIMIRLPQLIRKRIMLLELLFSFLICYIFLKNHERNQPKTKKYYEEIEITNKVCVWLLITFIIFAMFL